LPRGGKRQGSVGTAYSNRTDLNPVKPPTLVPTGQPYGQRQALVQSQQTLPVAPAGTTAAGPAPPEPIGQAPQPPVEPPAFHRPTDRPGEPITTGLPIGAGAGPEALGPNNLASQNLRTLVDMVASTAGASPEVTALAGFLRGRPGA